MAGSADTCISAVGVGVGVDDAVGVVVSTANVGGKVGVTVGIALCVSANDVPTVARTVSSMLVVSGGAGVDRRPLQDASIEIRNIVIILWEVFIVHSLLDFYALQAGGGHKPEAR